MKLDLICVDFQGDFINPDGLNFNKGSSVSFIKDTLFPFMKKNNLKACEIISDYRLPRGKSGNESCVPGTKGYSSGLPSNLRKGYQWVKCMHNPTWIRQEQDGAPKQPTQKPEAFDNWLSENIETKTVVLFGLTAECCLLNVAQELYFRGYEVYCVYEATDPMNERIGNKENIMFYSSVALYMKTINFEGFKRMVGND